MSQICCSQALVTALVNIKCTSNWTAPINSHDINVKKKAQCPLNFVYDCMCIVVVGQIKKVYKKCTVKYLGPAYNAAIWAGAVYAQ